MGPQNPEEIRQGLISIVNDIHDNMSTKRYHTWSPATHIDLAPPNKFLELSLDTLTTSVRITETLFIRPFVDREGLSYLLLLQDILGDYQILLRKYKLDQHPSTCIQVPDPDVLFHLFYNPRPILGKHNVPTAKEHMLSVLRDIRLVKLQRGSWSYMANYDKKKGVLSGIPWVAASGYRVDRDGTTLVPVESCCVSRG